MSHRGSHWGRIKEYEREERGKRGEGEGWVERRVGRGKGEGKGEGKKGKKKEGK